MNMRQFFDSEDRCDEVFITNVYPLVRGVSEIFRYNLCSSYLYNYYSWFIYWYDYNY